MRWAITFKRTARAAEELAPVGDHPSSDSAWRAFWSWRQAASVDFHTATASIGDR